MALTDNLVSYWKFENNADDEQPAGNDGTNNGATFVAGNTGFGQALNFDGTNDYVNVPHDATMNISPAITVAYWMKSTAGTPGSGNQVQIGKMNTSWTNSGTFYTAYREGPINNIVNGRIEFYITQAGGSGSRVWMQSDATITDNLWHHIVCTFDADDGTGLPKIYIDGVNVTPTGATYPGDPNGLYVAANHYGSQMTSIFTPNNVSIDMGTSRDASWTHNDYYKGLLDDAAIWARALTLAEVQDIYTRGVAGQTLLETTAAVDGSGIRITVV